MTDRELVRFFDKVVKARNGCWLWTGCLGGQGYGWLRVASDGGICTEGRAVPAHRLAYEHFVGPIPEAFTIDHLCRVRHCVNPEHLEAVTRGENVLRGVGFAAVNAAKTHCPQGHEYTPENTYRTRGGWRSCRTCTLARNRKRLAGAMA